MGKTSIIDIAVLKEKVQEYAMKVGRISARPVLLLYFVMVSKDTPKSDKLMILSTISYLVLPIDLVSAKRLPIIGWIDEAFSLSVAFQKVSKNITPEIEWKTDKLLDKWFPEYTKYILRSLIDGKTTFEAHRSHLKNHTLLLIILLCFLHSFGL